MPGASNISGLIAAAMESKVEVTLTIKGTNLLDVIEAAKTSGQWADKAKMYADQAAASAARADTAARNAEMAAQDVKKEENQ